MADLPQDMADIIWHLKRELLSLVNDTTATEFMVLELFGENELTEVIFGELSNVREKASSWFERLSSLQLLSADSQPVIASDMLYLIERSIEQIQANLPAMKQSIQEVKKDWDLI
ncbi:hypothetical protein [Pseudanabaena sp. PCC 6802]|uniref:hypothetical protein n=1 Tax=Pseudanabaena sp. PCC 6802 TaxID=118173 RepID=UPI00034B7E36|nr:hypothetical protein [Pseudanabaena sp. PCC 6802]